MSAIAQLRPNRSGSPDPALLMAAFQSLPESLAIVASTTGAGTSDASASGVIVYANPAWCDMFECSEPSQILGRPLDELVPACALSLRPGAPLNGERDNSGANFVHTRGDGARVHIELTRTLFRRRGGEFHVIHTRDVTRQKQIERQLGEAQALEAVGRLVPLGSAASFEALAGSTVTNTGPTVISGGNLGLSPGSAVTGFPPGTLTPPAVMHVTDPIAAQAELDLVAAYIYAAGVQGAAVLPGDLSGLTFTPGLYKTASTVMLSAGNVTLDAQGNANAVFIFQIGSTLTTIGSTQVILAGGAQAKNIFWQVGSSATLGTNSIFQGTIIALQSITLDTGATLTADCWLATEQ